MPRRVLLVCWGSRGDVAPLIGLGRGLLSRGEQVSVLAARDFADLVASAGLGFVPFEIDLRATADSAAGRSWLGGHRTLLGEGRAMQRVLDRFAAPLVDGLWERTEHADLLVSGVLTADACLSLAQARGQDHAVAMMAPLLPSRHGPSSASAVLAGSDSPVNLVVGRALMASSYRLLQVPGAEIRRRLGQPRTGARWFMRQLARTPTLLGASRYVVPPAPDQPQVTVTGYWSPWENPETADGAAEQTMARLETDLDRATRRGRPVVYLGFGSMTTADSAGTARLLVQAARLAGVHAVVHSGWSSLGWHVSGSLDVSVVEHVPHERLFARCDAVVHHGGAGTTGSAVRSGVPQVVVAHMGDQPYWARRMHRLGVAGPGLRRTGLTPARLSAAIGAVTTGSRATQRQGAAIRLAARVATENGVDAAVGVLSR